MNFFLEQKKSHGKGLGKRSREGEKVRVNSGYWKAILFILKGARELEKN